MKTPFVSVLMTAFNREQYIAEAIDSVLASDYDRFELIVVDDCSTDNTRAIAENFARQDTRIRVYANERNLGDYPNRNRAASYAKGDLLMFVDSDDMLYKDGLKNCVKAVQQFPAFEFGMQYFYGAREPFRLESNKTISDHFFKQPLLITGPGGTIMQRKFFEECGGYPELYGPANDMYFNLKAASRTPVVFIPFDFLYYRNHNGQESKNKYGYISGNYLYLSDALRELPLHLNKSQVRWLSKKNKRRFLTNSFYFLLKTKNIRKTTSLFQQTSFGLRDAIEAVFH